MRTGPQAQKRPARCAAALVRQLLALLLPVLLAGLPEGARAHAMVDGTEPADGAVLAQAPQEVVIRFSEPVSVIRAQVLDPAGADLLAPDAVAGQDSTLILDLPASLAQGTYTVSYRVVSLDGHPVGGSLVFSVGKVMGHPLGTQPASHAGAWRWALVASWSGFYLGLLGAAGGVLFLGLVRPGDLSVGSTRRIVAMSAGLGVLAALLAVGAQGGLLLDGPLGSLLDLRTWQAGASSTFGRAAYCAISGLLLILLGVARPSSGVWALLRATGVLLALGSFALTGHVVTAGPWWLTWPLLLVHVGIVAFWIGSLLPLHRALGTSGDHIGTLIERFSRVAVLLVPVLILAGVLIAVLQVRSVEALVTTEYGRVLLLKVILMTGLLMLATLNRLRLTPALVRGDPGASGRLSHSILAELGLVVAILGATATLGTTPPPRALAPGQDLTAADAHTHQEHGHGHAHGERTLALEAASFQADLTLQPGRVGANAVTIALRDPNGQPLEVMEVTLRIASPARGIEPLERVAERQELGHWQVRDLTLGVSGEWQLELDVLVSDFVRETATSTLVL